MATGHEATKKFLEKIVGKQLTEAELTEQKDKLIQFFSLLIEIDKRQQQKSNKK